MIARELLRLVLRVPARLAGLLCVVVAVLVPSKAFAAAPLCDEHAQSIEAPSILWPGDDGEIRAIAPCETARDAKWRSLPAPDGEQRQIAAPQIVDRVLPSLVRLPAVARSARLPVSPRVGNGERGAFLDDVFRPPR